jgi:hypothetical protein
MVSSPPLVKWYISALQQEDERGSLVAEKRRYATLHTTTYELQQQHNAPRIESELDRQPRTNVPQEEDDEVVGEEEPRG